MKSLGTGLLLSVLAFKLPLALAAAPMTPRPELLLVYWSSQDCKWCARWEGPTSGMELGLKKSDEFRKITYRVIKNDRLVDPYVDDDYPPDLKWLKDRVDRGEELPVGRPGWAFYVDKMHIASFYGVNAWNATIFPEIRKLVARYSTGERPVMPPSLPPSGGRY